MLDPQRQRKRRGWKREDRGQKGRGQLSLGFPPSILDLQSSILSSCLLCVSVPLWLPLLLEQGLDVGVGVERLQVVELLADADELDRQIQLLLDAEDGPALGRAVQFGQDNAGTPDRLLEHLRLGD